MGKGLFITGTDTGVGKTFVGGLLASLLRQRGINVGIMKPIETGCLRIEGNLYPQDTHYLKEKAESDDALNEIVLYTLEMSAAPVVAAAKEGVKISLDKIVEKFRILSQRHELTLVEGIGGLLVPLTPNQDVSHLILTLGIPAIAVARASLGTINHALLTVNWAIYLGIKIFGVVINHSSGEISPDERENLGALFARLSVPLLGIVPYLERPEKAPKTVLDCERVINYILTGTY